MTCRRQIALTQILLALVLLIPSRGYAADADAGTGLLNDVVFTQYSPLSRSEVLATRLLSPLTAAQMLSRAAKSGLRFRDQAIDLAHEKFAVLVPEQAPAPGYSLLVFISPLQGASVPPAWIAALQRHHMIFVSAANSGNPEDVFTRRVPLALLAAYNIMQRYPVDPERIYIGGMSGGSRVALRMALAFPDLFRGVLLHSGSDRIGAAVTPLPRADLLRQFQDSTRLVYLTGQRDRPALDADEESRESLHDWCVYDVDIETFAFAGHELAGAGNIELALAALEGHAVSKPDRLAACRAIKEKELTEKLRQVNELLEQGKSREAMTLLIKVDARFAGLASPESVELAKKIDALP